MFCQKKVEKSSGEPWRLAWSWYEAPREPAQCQGAMEAGLELVQGPQRASLVSGSHEG